MDTTNSDSPHRRKQTVLGFSETRWSQVVLAGSRDSPSAQEALAGLCEAYWHPIYSFLRRDGYDPHDAEDMTQQFFVRLLRKEAFANADQGKGRFRNFLLGALKHFVIDEYRRSTALKRGGPQPLLPIDIEEAERRYEDEPGSDLTPDQVFDRRWAASLLDQSLATLRLEFETAGHQKRFDALKGFLSGDARGGEYKQAAEALGMTLKATKMAVYRLRQQYRHLVREKAMETLVEGEKVDDELLHLFGGK